MCFTPARKKGGRDRIDKGRAFKKERQTTNFQIQGFELPKRKKWKALKDQKGGTKKRVGVYWVTTLRIILHEKTLTNRVFWGEVTRNSG